MFKTRRHGSPPRTVALLLLAVAAAACHDGPGGVAAPHVDEMPELSYAEEVRVGSVEDPDEGFSQIRALRISDGGDVYVLDGLAREVRVLGPQGERLRVIGGPGEGPGEFGLPFDMGLLGDTLWVYDPRLARLTWFDPEGNVLFITRGHGVPFESGQPELRLTLVPRHPRSDGLIESGLSRSVLPNREIRPYRYPVLLFDREGEVVDTLRWETADEAAVTFRVGGRELYVPPFLPRRPVEQDLADGRAVLDWSAAAGEAQGRLEALRLGPDGDTLHLTELRYDPVPVPPEVLDSLVTPRLVLAQTLGVSERELESALRAAVELPEFRPPLRSMHAGSDGTVWVQLNTPSTETAHWVIIEADGSVRGRLALPLGTAIRHSGLPTAWVVELDEFDVPWLLRLRVD